MKVVCYVDDGRRNFGDDLNRWLWNRILGVSLDTDDGTLMLGIGTVISGNLIPFAEKYIVLCSGAGYEAPPLDFGNPKWEILSVRGPLTAAALNLPPEKAITDGAALLRLLPECAPLPAAQRQGIAFMPHYSLLPDGNWKQACELAKVEFLDPLANSEETVQRIRRAKLVIAGAMHAAITSDALRVPWIPVVVSPQSNSFKWLDWTMSLDLPYHPAKLQASSLLELVRDQSIRLVGPKFYFEDHTPAKVIAHCKRVVRFKSWKYSALLRQNMTRITYSLPRRIITSAALSGFKQQQDEKRTYRAAEQLRRIAEMPSYLSDERVFTSKLDQIVSLLPRLQP